MTFQALILELQKYWSDQGCVILQPLDMEVGAGTFHPALLKAIGPSRGIALMYSHHADQRMGAMAIIQIAHNTFTNFKSFLNQRLSIFKIAILTHSGISVLIYSTMTFVLLKITGNHPHLVHGDLVGRYGRMEWK